MTPYSETITAMMFAFVLSVVAVILAKRAGFFKLPLNTHSSWPTFLQMVGSFFVYLLVSILLVPIFYLFIVFLVSGKFITHLDQLSEKERGWLQWTILLVTLIALLFYCVFIGKQAAKWIFWRDKPPSWKTAFYDFKLGAATWLVSYPLVIFLNLVLSAFIKYLWGTSGVEQVAVKQLLKVKEYPYLFGAMILAVIVIVPFIEELLFRGFLQSWLRRKIGRMGALITTAAIFATVHFSTSQGVGNLELIVSLFVLSLFLGFLYERQKTLWASFGLHSVFNGFSALLIVFSKG